MVCRRPDALGILADSVQSANVDQIRLRFIVDRNYAQT